MNIYQVDTAAAAAAKLLQSCPTLCDPIDGSPPAPPSMGFSRQEYWSGVPLPSPVSGQFQQYCPAICISYYITDSLPC